MINKPTKLIVHTIILITAITFSPSVYGAEPSLQCDEYLWRSKLILQRYASNISMLEGNIRLYKFKLESLDEREKLIYRHAIEGFKEGIPFSKDRFKSLSGMDYKNYEEFTTWWKENSNYLNLSDDKKTLFVDEKAKKERRILNEIDFFHIPYKQEKCPKGKGYYPELEIPAKAYWAIYLHHRPINIFADSGEYINIELDNDEIERYSVKKSDLRNLYIKLDAYIRFAKIMISNMKYKERNIDYEVNLLKNITTQNFSDYNSWQTWWNKNKDNLVLNKEGTKLVVKK